MNEDILHFLIRHRELLVRAKDSLRVAGIDNELVAEIEFFFDGGVSEFIDARDRE